MLIHIIKQSHFLHKVAVGRVEELGHIGQAQMLPGDVFEIHTPGGGGFGRPAK